MADGSRKLVMELQELTPEDLFQVVKNDGKMGYFIFSPKKDQLTEKQLENLPEITVEKDEKSPSARLRARMFVYYKEKFGKTEGFYEWYASSLDKVGQQYLDKLK